MATQSQGRGSRPDAKVFSSPRSTHTSDAFLRDFLDPAFDPAAFLNASLPPLAPPARTASGSGAGRQAGTVPLAELSSQAQTLLLQLNTHTARLSGVLTQLADEILRSGSRLAYEVELLRGEALGLEEAMGERLQEEIEMFVPEGLGGPQQQQPKESQRRGQKEQQQQKEHGLKEQDEQHKHQQQQQQQQQQQKRQDEQGEESGEPQAGEDPIFVQQLQTLTLVRARLDSVIKTFGDAMEFVFPPSEISLSSGFLSVSAPEPGSEQQSSEEKGHEVLRSLREEISALLQPPTSGYDPLRGVERAAERVEALKELATVWRGTAEEKGRGKFIEGLAKMVEDRHRELLREVEQARRAEEQWGGLRQGRTIGGTGGGGGGGGGEEKAGGPRAGAAAAVDDGRVLPGGFGLMSQLQKLRSGL